MCYLSNCYLYCIVLTSLGSSIGDTEETEKMTHLCPCWTPTECMSLIGSQRFKNLPKITNLVRGRAAFRTRQCLRLI